MLTIVISPYLSEKSSDFDEFCKQQQILNWMNVTWSKMKKLHWTDSEFDRTHFLFVLISSTTASDWGLSMASHRSCLRRTPRPSSICYVLGAVDICSVGNALCCVLCPEDKLLMSSLRVARSCLLFFSLSGLKILDYIADGGTHRHPCTMVHIGLGQVFSPLGALPQDSRRFPQIQNLGHKYRPFDRDYLENG